MMTSWSGLHIAYICTTATAMQFYWDLTPRHQAYWLVARPRPVTEARVKYGCKSHLWEILKATDQVSLMVKERAFLARYRTVCMVTTSLTQVQVTKHMKIGPREPSNAGSPLTAEGKSWRITKAEEGKWPLVKLQKYSRRIHAKTAPVNKKAGSRND